MTLISWPIHWMTGQQMVHLPYRKHQMFEMHDIPEMDVNMLFQRVDSAEQLAITQLAIELISGYMLVVMKCQASTHLPSGKY